MIMIYKGVSPYDNTIIITFKKKRNKLTISDLKNKTKLVFKTCIFFWFKSIKKYLNKF